MFFVSVGGRPVHVLVAWQQLLNHVVGFPTVDGLYKSRVIKRTRDILKNTSDHPMCEFYSVAKLGCRYERSDIAILSYPLASGCSMQDWGGGSEWGEGEVNGERGKWMGRGGSEWGEGEVNGESGKWMGRVGSEWGEGEVNGERGKWMGRGGSEWGEGEVNGERGYSRETSIWTVWHLWLQRLLPSFTLLCKETNIVVLNILKTICIKNLVLCFILLATDKNVLGKYLILKGEFKTKYKCSKKLSCFYTDCREYQEEHSNPNHMAMSALLPKCCSFLEIL